MSANKTFIIISSSLVFLVILIAVFLNQKKERLNLSASSKVHILESWELPEELDEISGMVSLDQNTLAAVQDEKGEIFLYDLQSRRIERSIRFAGNGDYEAIAIVGSSAFIADSRGNLYEVKNFLESPEVVSYQTPLNEQNDLEGLVYDPSKKKLYMALKGDDLNDQGEHLYAFDLQKKEFEKDPVVRINLKTSKFSSGRFYPSEVSIDPVTGHFVLLEAENPQIIIVNSDGLVLKHYRLDKKDFPQPEGLSFDQEHNLLISSEGEPGILHKVSLE